MVSPSCLPLHQLHTYSTTMTDGPLNSNCARPTPAVPPTARPNGRDPGVPVVCQVEPGLGAPLGGFRHPMLLLPLLLVHLLNFISIFYHYCPQASKFPCLEGKGAPSSSKKALPKCQDQFDTLINKA